MAGAVINLLIGACAIAATILLLTWNPDRGNRRMAVAAMLVLIMLAAALAEFAGVRA